MYLQVLPNLKINCRLTLCYFNNTLQSLSKKALDCFEHLYQSIIHCQEFKLQRKKLQSIYKHFVLENDVLILIMTFFKKKTLFCEIKGRSRKNPQFFPSYQKVYS